MTPMKSIRAKCLECSGNSSNEVKLCAIFECALHPYRFGKRPGGAKSPGRALTPEHLAKMQAGRKSQAA
jgi:hypothetical protein